ncbi:hypothetical protein [Candidatus Erwinia dacicola]|uniref:Uncharacterized protein n=1 Tax=Candidatus Erwinia dacicola TaxID=252393 RepID=A0A1E7YZY9_9GAMM|nr:hypothetical protein [Candidatus Erwinia dacicola]OFC62106.1 hypothetical protein BBW68_10825 [Candidatus Erwinia dacicola]RAP70848.1 hypothetical protein ACZ87_02347 [Candidatus Erwinia dacicola]
MTNYAKLSEYTAYKKQAQDAADRRRLSLAMLERKSGDLKNLCAVSIDAQELTALAQDAARAEEEMHAAVGVANQAAPLCGEQKIDIKLLMHI